MLKLIQSTINFLLKPLGLSLQKSSIKWERDALLALYKSRAQWTPKISKYPSECIVFSKDRALQLHALLTSYLEKASSPVPLHVLYHTTNASHQKSYEELIELFPTQQVTFTKQCREDSFKEDLIQLLTLLQSEKFFFLVDDLVFIEDLDILDFSKFDTDKFVPSLRMGLNLTKTFHLKQPLPELLSSPEEEGKIFWKWNEGMYDWGYPLSVDGHLFSTREILEIIKMVSFHAPNTLEDSLQQFSEIFLSRVGVSYRKSIVVNIPCNKVQLENENIFGNIHQDFLLEQWNKGFQIDYKQLYGFDNISVHQEIAFDLIKR
ncbi:hypothetical protein ACFL03_00855 [Thermodesulfobacteriota bacterium]